MEQSASQVILLSLNKVIQRSSSFFSTLPWNPPPIQWFCGDGFIFGTLTVPPEHTQPHRLLRCTILAASFFLRQLGWWVLRPPLEAVLQLRNPRRDQPPPRLPPRISLLACWLNAFDPDEVRTWMACGVSDWRQLRHRVPWIQSGAAHKHRRSCWPDQCAPACRLLADKPALLQLADPNWNVPCIILEKGAEEFSLGMEKPPWWHDALRGPGVILKPLRGSGCRGVVRYFFSNGTIESEVLFRAPSNRSEPQHPSTDPGALFRHWQNLIQSKEKAIAMPYLEAAPSLPSTSPSLVVRVITGHDQIDSPITVRCAWLELPLSDGSLALITLNGRVLPNPEPIQSAAEQAELLEWQTLLIDPPPLIKQCLDHSVTMHQRLPPIDQVAWDWIPTASGPILLEGNSSFSLLEPQLIAQIST
jgi:hypothetical protein